MPTWSLETRGTPFSASWHAWPCELEGDRLVCVANGTVLLDMPIAEAELVATLPAIAHAVVHLRRSPPAELFKAPGRGGRGPRAPGERRAG